MTTEQFTISEQILQDPKFKELRKRTMKMLKESFELRSKTDLKKALSYMVDLCCKSVLFASELEFYITILEKLFSEDFEQGEKQEKEQINYVR